MLQSSSNLTSGQPPKKKRLLLIDANAGKSALRVEIMGKAGFDVDCASDTSAARVLWHANSYHLVLIDLRHDVQGAEDFCAEIKSDSPRQAVAFLVGKPAYLSASPNPELSSEPVPLPGEAAEKITLLLANHGSAPPVRDSFSEALGRMSAKRSLYDSRPKKTSAQSFGEAVRRVQNEDRVAANALALHSG